MLIDWVTVAGQAVNFLILVWLMKRFLYKPIREAIDGREKRIAKELADADAAKASAQKSSDEFRHKNEEFDLQRAALMTKATDEAQAVRRRLLDEAAKAADALGVKRREALRREDQALKLAIRQRTQEEVFSIARRALKDLATTSLEERLADAFIRQLQDLDAGRKEALRKALGAASTPLVIRSAFDLPPPQRAAINDALNRAFSADLHLTYEAAPQLVSGIELVTSGQKVAWSIADYLASLQTAVEELLEEREAPEAKPGPEPEAHAAKKRDDAPGSKPETNAAPTPATKLEVTPSAEPEPGPPAAPAAT
jgi:F-type H+-transporting ATPase subunit b